jgi:hypothetical protein
MALHWDVSKIDDHEKLCYTENDDGTFNVRPVTDNLIFGTMAVDIGGITDENAQEFYIRMCEYSAASGFDVPVSLEDVRRHIGLRTNVGSTKPGRWAQWRKKLAYVWRDRIGRELQWAAEKEAA